MARLVALDLDPSDRTLRQFGFIALGAFSLLALLAWRELLMFGRGLGALRAPVTFGLLGLALISLTFALVRPQANRLLYMGLSIVAYRIGQALSYVLLALLFYGVFGVVGILLRVFARDPMTRVYSATAQSYWVPRRRTAGVESYLRQS